MIEKRGSSYRVRIHHNGQRHCRSFATPEEAARFESVIRSELARGLTWERAVATAERAHADPYTVGEAIADWLTDARAGLVRTAIGTEFRPATIAGLEQHTRLFLPEAFLDLEIEEADRAAVRDVLLAVRASGPASAERHVLSALRLVYRRLVHLGRLADDPTASFAMPQVPRRARQPSFTPEEAARLLAAAHADRDPEIAAFIDLALVTGARLGELLALTWGRDGVDLGRRQVVIWRSFDRHSKAIGPTKNGRFRTIGISRSAAARLHDFRVARREHVPTADGDAVFVTRAPQHAFRRCRDAAGLADSGASIHTLRHSVASWLLHSGLAPHEVAPLLGHASAQFLIDVYGHTLAADRRDAIRNLDNFRRS